MKLRPNTFAMTAVLALMTSLGPLSTDLYLPSLPAIALALDATTSRTQLTLSAFLAGFAVGQIFYGSLSDRHGRRPVLLVGLAVFCLGTLVCALAPDIGTLIAGRFIQAIGGSGPIVLARAMVRDLYDGKRAAQELAIMGTIMGIVPAIAPVAGGLLQTLIGWRAGFVAVLLFGIALLVTALTILPESIRRRSSEPFSLRSIIGSFGHLLRVPAYRVYVGVVALTYSGLFAWISGSSFVLQGIYGLSAVRYALSFLVVVAGFVLGGALAQRGVRTLGPEKTVGVGMACLAIGGVVMLLAVLLGLPNAYAIVVPMAVYGCGVGLTLPSGMALAMAPFPDRAGAASSFLGLCQMSCAALVGASVGAALGQSALPMALAVAATGALALTLFLTTHRTRMGA